LRARSKYETKKEVIELSPESSARDKVVCLNIRLTILNNFLQSLFSKSSLQTSLRQEQLTLPHNAKTNCHNPKIDSQKRNFTAHIAVLLNGVNGSAWFCQSYSIAFWIMKWQRR